jgi:hypothetical protein
LYTEQSHCLLAWRSLVLSSQPAQPFFLLHIGLDHPQSAIGLEEVFGPAGPSKCEVFGFNWYPKLWLFSKEETLSEKDFQILLMGNLGSPDKGIT